MIRICPKCGATLSETTSGIRICPNCGAYATTTERWTPNNAVNLPLIISNESLENRSLEADLNNIITRLSTLEADSERFDFNIDSLKKRCADLATDVSLINHEMNNLKKLLNARCENLLDQIHDEKDKVRYIYIIRERAKLCEDGWNIVGNVVYPTFNDANEKLKKLIKDYRQLEPDYDANNLNIIQVRLEE